MRPLDLEALLDLVGETARRREPLAPALRESGQSGTDALAAELEAGRSLPDALRGLLPPAYLDVFAMERPGLEAGALLVSQELRLARKRRELVVGALAYPAVCAAIFAGVCVWVAASGRFPLATGWLLVLLPGFLLNLLLPILPVLWPRLADRLPIICGWSQHLARWRLFSRAGLAARWRLTEEQLAPLLGDDLGGLGPILGGEEAEPHCQDLAIYHRQAAEVGLRRLVGVMTVGWYVVIFALAMACYGGLMRGYLSYLEGL